MKPEQPLQFRFDREKAPAPGILDLTGENCLSAHFTLGRRYKNQILAQLAQKLANLTPAELTSQLSLIQRSRQQCLYLSENLKSKNKDGKNKDEQLIGHAIGRYFDCLDFWASGAQIPDFLKRMHLADHLPDKMTNFLSPVVSLWLQNDNVSCLTVMYRPSEQTVVIGHTEEDTTGSYRCHPEYKPEVAVLTSPFDSNRKISALMIPYLLPGPAFAFDNKGYFQSVNGLYQAENPNGRALSNMAVWLTMTLGNLVDPVSIIQTLSPFIDGYSLNTACLSSQPDKRPTAVTVKFIHDQIEVRELAEEPGSVLIVNNIIDEKNYPLTAACQFLPETSLEYRKKRETMVNCQSRLPRVMANIVRRVAARESQQSSIESYIQAMAILLSLQTPKLPIRNDRVVSTGIYYLSPEEMAVVISADSASKAGYELKTTYRL